MISVEWLGNAGFYFRHSSGRALVVDPWLDGNPGCPFGVDNAPEADYVLVTHGHPGHFGRAADCVRLAKRLEAPLLSSSRLCSFVTSKFDVPVIAVDPGHALEPWPDCVVMAFAVDHPPVDPSTDLKDAPGDPNMGFLLNWDGMLILHIGDAEPDPIFRILGSSTKFDLVCLPSWIPNMHEEDEEQTIARMTTICAALRPKVVFPHARYDPALRTAQKLQSAVTEASLDTFIAYGPPGTQFDLGPGEE